MSFQFNFNHSPSSSREASPEPQNAQFSATAKPLDPLPAHALPSLIPLTEIITTLPSSLSYSRLPSPLSLPRRPLFDTKLQAFSAPTLPATTSAVHLGLSSPSDLHRGTYEGGFKTWEGAVDLAAHLLAEGGIEGGVKVVELGAGAALPAVVVLREVVRSGRKARIVVQDFNREVLELVSLPNLVLGWLDLKGELEEEEGDVDLSGDVGERFVRELGERGIELVFVSGGWGAEMAEMLGGLGVGGGVVLAAETIYQSDSLPYFLEVLEKTIGSEGKALVAAKEFYFGVGGNVGEFIDAVRRRGGIADTKWRDDKGGVGRVIVEVRR